MNVIVIDDLIHVVKGIVSGVDWDMLGVAQVFEAHNSVEARKIFEHNRIDIMVCDIEMPMGNGLQLLEWVRENSPRTECIFLTSHGEFEYAKAALKLGSFDYLLQPIKYEELETVIARAIEKVKKDTMADSYYEYGVYWKENQGNIREKFWRDVLSGVYKDDLKKIKAAAHGIGLDGEDRAYVVSLFTILRRDIVMKEWDDELLKYALSNILTEIMAVEFGDLTIVQMDSNHIVFVVDEDTGVGIEKLNEKCQYFIQAAMRDLKCSLACYIGESSEMTGLPDLMQRLYKVDRNNVASHSRVFLLGDGRDELSLDLEIKDLKRWETLLVQGNSEKVSEEVTLFLEQLMAGNSLNAAALFKFHHEFIQMYNRVVEARQIDTQRLYKEKSISELYMKSMSSVQDMLVFVKFLLSLRYDEEHFETYYQTSIDTIKTYIDENLEKELSRNELADRVYLNPDYLSRLFKKETGISLIEYITNQRISVSKELLVKTDMSVSIIASKVGYSNFSHFSQVFKKVTGLTPNEFRQKNR